MYSPDCTCGDCRLIRTLRGNPQTLTRFDADGARAAHAAVDASGPATPSMLDARMAAHAAIDAREATR